MAKCEYCGKEVALPFRCRYCGGLFCVEHHLPEKHNCPGLKRGVEAFKYRIQREFIEERKKPRITIKIERPRLKFLRREESLELLVAALLVSVVYLSVIPRWNLIPLVVGVVVAFLTHELSHKFTAIKLGYIARFKLSKLGALLTLISAIPIIPIKMIAPGYVSIVSIGKFPSVKDEGLIALAGPLSNIILSILGTVSLLFLHEVSYISLMTLLFVKVNLDIALFNLMPLLMLDGEKIFRWNAFLWGLLTIIVLIANVRLTFTLYLF